jgi:serine/threonine protein kinase
VENEISKWLDDDNYNDDKYDNILLLHRCVTPDLYVNVYTKVGSDKVIKEFSPVQYKNYDPIASRWFTECEYHTIAQKYFPEYTLPIHDIINDSSFFCIIYERGQEISEEFFRGNLRIFLNIIIRFNEAGMYHLDTKYDNFLYDSKRNCVIIHDFGLCYFDLERNTLSPEEIRMIFLLQMRLLFTDFGELTSEHLLLLLEYSIPLDITNLPIETMYHDIYFKNIEPILLRVNCFDCFDNFLKNK